MHEMSIAENIVQIVLSAAEEQHFNKVACIWVEIGMMSHVQAEALEFCFSSVGINSLLENAKLIIVKVPGKGRCQNCQSTFEYSARYDPCPNCGDFDVAIIDGEQMNIQKLEVE